MGCLAAILAKPLTQTDFAGTAPERIVSSVERHVTKFFDQRPSNDGPPSLKTRLVFTSTQICDLGRCSEVRARDAVQLATR